MLVFLVLGHGSGICEFFNKPVMAAKTGLFNTLANCCLVDWGLADCRNATFILLLVLDRFCQS
jgi:hypothetical protein